ncbi:MalY/PatB family protein [Nonomuraea cavernae]|uniref:MalY/PatB family protein n=1 Tax=Nonomuraea cavernae TaxID=2045107 RepID=UPI0033EC663E
MDLIFDIPLEELRRRRSAKWTHHPSDVLPLPVAEMDVRLAPSVAAALRSAVERSDTGYAGDSTELTDAFRGFAWRRWRWQVEVGSIRTCADVAVGATEVLRRLVSPGDGVVVMPPVYPPFYAWVREAGAEPVPVPLIEQQRGGRLDLDGIERALEGGVRVVLLCHPHNPLGRVHDLDELRALAELARRHGATVISDEIHGPLTHPGHTFHPYLTVSDAAIETGITLTSASKAFNLAGLKCALIVTERHRAMFDRLPHELSWGVGHLGALAATAAYTDGDDWLDRLNGQLAANAALLRDLLARQLSSVTFPEPQATYLAWLDCSPLGFGPDPAATFLDRARVALSSGPDFGAPGQGHTRFNYACSPALIEEAIARMAQIARL